MNGYQILMNSDEKELEEQVVQAMNEGWEPTGGVAIIANTITGYPSLYAQAIMKKEKKPS